MSGATSTRDVRTLSGRVLAVAEAGDPAGPAVVSHHGTPGGGGFYRTELESADRLGLRLIAYDRPGYGGSTPHIGRTVAAAAAEVEAILDALGVERFATHGHSGGGPHALACAALLPERCMAAVSSAGVAPADAPDLDFMAGMGEGNRAELGAAKTGRAALTAFCIPEMEEMQAVGAQELARTMAPHLSPVDAAAMTGEFAEYLTNENVQAFRQGVAGWIEDDLAFLTQPWGFDLSTIAVPTLIWQGEQDLMVPAGHGRWLAEHIPGCEWRYSPQEGHITLFVNGIATIHEWLAAHLR